MTKEKHAAQQRVYYWANRDEIRRRRRTPEARAKDAAKKRRLYRKDPKGVGERNRVHHARSRRRNYAYLRQYVKDHPCVDCGQVFHFAAMDFDHVRGEKVAGVSQLASQPVSMEKLLVEVAKCEVRCANCHRVRTFKVLVAQGRAWE